jgi:hypothetical protein
VLNQDFNAAFDFTSPAEFSGVAANVGITFVLETVIRKATTKTSWGTRDNDEKLKKRRYRPYSYYKT